MFVKLTVTLVGWAAGASAIATAPPTDIWQILYLVFWVTLGVGAGTFSRLGAWVIEVTGEDGKPHKVIDTHLRNRDLAAIGIYFVGGFAFGAVTGWMAELVGVLAMCFAAIGVVQTRRLIFDGLGALVRNAASQSPSSTNIDGEAK